MYTKNIYEAEGITGHVRLVPGAGNKSVLEFRQDGATNRSIGSNLVITVADHKIVSMTEYRRTTKARRIADAA